MDKLLSVSEDKPIELRLAEKILRRLDGVFYSLIRHPTHSLKPAAKPDF